jgi:hypothetical protein
VDYLAPSQGELVFEHEKIGNSSMFARPVAAMTRIGAKLACGLLVALVFAGESPRAQVLVGPQGPEQGVIRRQTWLIPAQDHTTLMRTTVIRPPGEGPFPRAAINHGAT